MIKLPWTNKDKAITTLRAIVEENKRDQESCHAAQVAIRAAQDERDEIQRQYIANPTPELARKMAALDAEIQGIQRQAVAVSSRAHGEAYQRIAERTLQPLKAAIEAAIDKLESEHDRNRSDLIKLHEATGASPDKRKADLDDLDRLHGYRMNSLRSKLAALDKPQTGMQLHSWASDLIAA